MSSIFHRAVVWLTGQDESLATLNCRPGDLAYVVGTTQGANLNGRIVKIADEPADFSSGTAVWKLKDRLVITPSCDLMTCNGCFVRAGQAFYVFAIGDEHLRPIRDPGDGAVDEMVGLVGVAPKTLTEVREVTS